MSFRIKFFALGPPAGLSTDTNDNLLVLIMRTLAKYAFTMITIVAQYLEAFREIIFGNPYY